MNERQQLEADYDRAKECLENAVFDLSNLTLSAILRDAHPSQRGARTNLRGTVAVLAKSKFDLPEARANLERARANCHRTMLALEEFDRTQASQWSAQSSGCFVRNVERPQAKIDHDEKSVGSFAVSHRDELLVPRDKAARALLVKHTVMLFSLVLAFLQYYLLDTQLQIERLPPSAVYVVGQ